MSTKVSTPAPQPMSAAETDLIKAQTEQLRNLERIQQAQYEQFQQFAPAQMAAFDNQVKLANLAVEEARRGAPQQAEAAQAQLELLKMARDEAARRAPFEQQTLESQQRLLQMTTEEAQRRAQLERATLPALLESAGQKAIFDAQGNIVGVEKLPLTELEKLQQEFAEESTKQALMGIRGEIPVGDPFERRIMEDRTALRERLRAQLGPGFETSSPGIEALSQFDAKAAEARENIRFGRLSEAASLSNLGAERLSQAELRNLEILNRAGASTLPGAFSMASSFGGQSNEALARAFALAQEVRSGGSGSLGQAFSLSGGIGATGADALSRSAGFAGAAGGMASSIAGSFAQDRRIIDAANRQAALQSAANRAQQTAGIFSMLGTSVGTAGGLYAMSSREFKENNAPINVEDILDGIKGLNIESWNYKPEIDSDGERHIGPYAEEFREEFGIGDGNTINLLDAVGVLFAAVKALEKRTSAEGR